MKKHLVAISATIQTIIAIILLVIGYNIKNTYTQNIFFSVSLLVCGVFWTILLYKTQKKAFEGVVIGVGILCAFVTVTSLYSAMDTQFGWSLNKGFNEIKANVQKDNVLIYQTNTTKLYLNEENMRLYSVTDFGEAKYFYQTNLSEYDKSEYPELYSLGLSVKSESEKVPTVAIHPATISTLTDSEHLIEITYNDNIYLAPTFLMGRVETTQEMEDVVIIKYSDKSDQNYTVSKIDDNMYIRNDFTGFVSPFANVQYNEDAMFKDRYIQFMKSFDSSYELDEVLTFGVSKTIEVNGTNVQRVTFYYEIYNESEEGSLLMEIAYNDGTADVCYAKEVYPENFTKVSEVIK